MALKLRILRSLTRFFIILVSLMRSLFSEKMLISYRCISGLMPNLIKKSWMVSTDPLNNQCFVIGFWLIHFLYIFPTFVIAENCQQTFTIYNLKDTFGMKHCKRCRHKKKEKRVKNLKKIAKQKIASTKAELLQLNRTQFLFLGIL